MESIKRAAASQAAATAASAQGGGEGERAAFSELPPTADRKRSPRERVVLAASKGGRPDVVATSKRTEATSAKSVRQREGERQQWDLSASASCPRESRSPVSKAAAGREGATGAGRAAAAVAAGVVEQEHELRVTCSKCGLGAEDVLLLSCRHHLCLLCAAAAAAAQATAASQGRQQALVSESERVTSRLRSNRRREEVLSCPLCGAFTVLSASSAAALWREPLFFQNPPGCCLDAGPVGSAAAGAGTAAAGAAARGRETQQFQFITLCSQCEKQAAEVYCGDCVRRFCGSCAVEVHQHQPRMLAHRFQLLHPQQEQQLYQQREKGKGGGDSVGFGIAAAPADFPAAAARAALQQAVQHMRTTEDTSTYISTVRSGRSCSLSGRATGRGRKCSSPSSSLSHSSSTPHEVASVHSSAIRLIAGDESQQDYARATEGSGKGGASAGFGGAALLHRLRHVLAAVSLPSTQVLEGAAHSPGDARATQLVSPELLRLRSVTNVGCYTHSSQPVEFFCCSCECYCVCAYCLTGFFPSGSAAAPSGAAAPQLQTEDHSGHFLQPVDAAWKETVLPRIEDEWGGPPTAAGVDGDAAADKGEESAGRGILGQVRSELELLQQQFLQEKRSEWARRLLQDKGVVNATSELLHQHLVEKEEQLRAALETFTVRFCSESEEARRRLQQQAAELQETLRVLRMNKAALDPTVLLNYFREGRSRLEELRAADTPGQYRELPLSRKALLQHAAQVTEELCGLTAELGMHVREADGTLFERLQQQQQLLQKTQNITTHSTAGSVSDTDTSPSVGEEADTGLGMLHRGHRGRQLPARIEEVREVGRKGEAQVPNLSADTS